MGVAIAGAGIDTWSVCWRVAPESSAADALTAAATGSANRGTVLPEKIAGYRVGWNSGVGMLWAEGHPGGDVLGRPADLAAERDRLEVAMLEQGVPVPIGRAGQDVYGDRYEGFAGVRRLDSTVDLAVDESAEGLAIMAGIAAVARELPRSKANLWFGSDGLLQTVAMHGFGGGQMLGRVYDKGAEAGTAPRGRLLRPEDQRRWAKGWRRDPEELTGQYVREKFHNRFAPLWRATKGVTVGGPIVLAEKLVGLVQEGELSAAQAETLGGHLLMQQLGLPGQSASTRKRRRRALREHGLVIADGVLQEVEIDLGDVLTACMDGAAWEANG